MYQDFLITSVEKGHQIDTIYTDLSKAFDSVCHTLLLKKLSEIGISGNYLAWISSYLQDRSQWVEICGSRSGEVFATSGVPQGSHMGPVLFSLFINDVKSCFRSSKILLYADDLKMYGRVQPGGDYLQSDLDRFVYWCSENFLKINVSKCKAISFYKTVNPYNTGYVINGEPVEAVEFINDLGVIFDRNLSFNLHINNITLKGLRLLGFIKRNTKYMTDTRALMCLYNCLVLSILEYCSVIWSPTYDVHKNRLERVQNKFIRYLLFKHHFPSFGVPYETRLLLCGMKSLETRRRNALFLFLFKLLNNEIKCDTLLQLVSFQVPVRQTRQQQLFHVRLHRTNYGLTAFVDRMLMNYNRFYADCDIFRFKLPRIKFLIAQK